MNERTAIRFGIPALVLAAGAGALLVSLDTATSAIPSFAFGSRAVLAVQVALLFFYAALLLLVPLVRALADGALPIELSVKGARWAEEVDDLSEGLSARVTRVEEKALTDGFKAHQEIAALKEILREVTGYDEPDAGE